MRRWSTAAAVAVAAGLAIGGAAAAKTPVKTPPAKTSSCGEYGTSVNFEDSPAEAAKQAKKDEKLVMVLHVSGHFEDPRFT